MPLHPGMRLGPYEIAAALGAGGMGEVYRARDTRLGREVAIKVLPQHLIGSPEVRARFEREARTVSALNHPNICTLFDVGREGETDYLVMELVEGETLAQRLAKGPLPPGDVFRYGGQIADALDRAHRAGVIHRDLKPANVMITRSGAKLMDFGLARATGLGQPAPALEHLAQSPTVAQPLTAEGTLVGTYQYMAPEQLEGREADARSDLWAFGVMLYEMASGRRPFEGRSQASLIGAIMNAQPAPLAQLAPLAPLALERLVLACLAKDPDERIQTAHDVRLQLGWSSDASGPSLPAPVLPPRRATGAPLAWALVALFALASAVLTGMLVRHAGPRLGTLRVAVAPPGDAVIDIDEENSSISPDGTKLAFVATDTAGATQLWVRELASSAPRPLPDTQQATLPFWSPDGRFIGFFAGGRLRKVDVAGRDVQDLCAAPDGRGGTWNSHGTIVFAPAPTGGLEQVSDAGGGPRPATVPDRARSEVSHRFPDFLPDGVHFLYVTLSHSDAFVSRMGSLRERGSRAVLEADGAARYAAPGHLLFARRGVLLVQRFDPRTGRLSGEPRALGPAPSATQYTGGPPGSVSANGVIEQRDRVVPALGLTWLDREGRAQGDVAMAPGAYSDLALSRDDARAALVVHAADGDADVWTIDLARGLSARLTTDLKSCERPLWSLDGRAVTFSCLDGDRRSLWRQEVGGSSGAQSYWHGVGNFEDPLAWSPDGGTLFERDLSPTTGEDIYAIRNEGGLKRFPVLTSRFHEEDAAPSPDGRWLAYRSDESGRTELYVQSYPGGATKVRVSAQGAGTHTRSALGRAFWRRDGREMAYVSGDGVTVMSVPVETAGGIRAGTPRPLFRIPPSCTEMVAASSLQRFLVLEPRDNGESGSIQLIVNWPASDRQP